MFGVMLREASNTLGACWCLPLHYWQTEGVNSNEG